MDVTFSPAANRGAAATTQGGVRFPAQKAG
jgi:hypothetical protein